MSACMRCKLSRSVVCHCMIQKATKEWFLVFVNGKYTMLDHFWPKRSNQRSQMQFRVKSDTSSRGLICVQIICPLAHTDQYSRSIGLTKQKIFARKQNLQLSVFKMLFVIPHSFRFLGVERIRLISFLLVVLECSVGRLFVSILSNFSVLVWNLLGSQVQL